MIYDAALTCFAHTRGDDAGDVIRSLCAIAAAANLVGDRAQRDRTWRDWVLSERFPPKGVTASAAH